MALPFLADHRSHEYDPILKEWHLEGRDLAQLERKTLDWDHAEVASWICSDWELPENIALAIRNHHDPSTDEDPETLAPVRIVSILRENQANDGLEEMIEHVTSVYPITESKMRMIVEPSLEKAKDLARIIV